MVSLQLYIAEKSIVAILKQFYMMKHTLKFYINRVVLLSM